MYQKLRLELSTADQQLTLALAIKAMNEMLGPNDVVPSTLLLGEHLPAFIRSKTPKKPFTLNNRKKKCL